MINIKCKACGSPVMRKNSEGLWVCEFCGSKYLSDEGQKVVSSTVTDAKLISCYYEAEKYREREEYTEELKVLINALEIDENNAVTLVKLGRCYRALSMYSKALELYSRAISIDPSNGHAYTNMGMIYNINSEWEKAQEWFEKGLPLIDISDDGYWVVRANYAITVAKLGNKEKAEELISAAQRNGYPYADNARKLAGLTETKSGGCYVATCVYGSYDCPQVWTLRRYRDYSLAKTWYGRAFIHTYYAISPTIVKIFGNQKWVKTLWKHKLDKMIVKLHDKGIEDTPYNDIDW